MRWAWKTTRKMKFIEIIERTYLEECKTASWT